MWKKITGQSVGHCFLVHYVFHVASIPHEVELLVVRTKNQQLLSYVEAYRSKRRSDNLQYWTQHLYSQLGWSEHALDVWGCLHCY